MPMTFEDLKKTIASEWLKLVLILCTVVGGWYKFDYRISAMEARQRETQEQIQQLTPVIEKLDRTLDRLQQAMRDFPLHRHLNDDTVIYPGDAELRDGKHR